MPCEETASDKCMGEGFSERKDSWNTSWRRRFRKIAHIMRIDHYEDYEMMYKLLMIWNIDRGWLLILHAQHLMFVKGTAPPPVCIAITLFLPIPSSRSGQVTPAQTIMIPFSPYPQRFVQGKCMWPMEGQSESQHDIWYMDTLSSSPIDLLLFEMIIILWPLQKAVSHALLHLGSTSPLGASWAHLAWEAGLKPLWLPFSCHLCASWGQTLHLYHHCRA